MARKHKNAELLVERDGKAPIRMSVARYCKGAPAKHCAAARKLRAGSSVRVGDVRLTKIAGGAHPAHRHRGRIAPAEVRALEREYARTKREYHDLGDQVRAAHGGG